MIVRPFSAYPPYTYVQSGWVDTQRADTQRADTQRADTQRADTQRADTQVRPYRDGGERKFHRPFSIYHQVFG